jgi:crotonobetainyl-CoA:carnitine CoA-transferase CaiB-like acyl-CoA transferase
MRGLRDLRVLDLSTGIAGAYATKLLADAGADVVKVESAEGDPLRRWSASGADLRGRDGALFRFLHTSKRSVRGEPEDAAVQALLAGADLVVESGAAADPRGWCERFPGLVVLSLTPWGRKGPYAGRPASEFTVQAESGSIATRGLASQPPYMAGGRTTEWVGGTYAAVAALAALRRAREHGVGEHVDFSLLEVMNIAGTMYADLFHALAGRPPTDKPARTVEIPSIEPTKDGWVGFNTNSQQQFRDFLLLIERTDLLEDRELALIPGRWKRMDEWNALVRAWTTRHTTAEIVERASLLRIPVAPVNDGRSVLLHEQFVARGVFVPNPDGDFRQPRPPWKLDGASPPPFRPAPRLGEHTGAVDWPPRDREAARPPTAGAPLPLEGLRVLDATAWWAGPSATHMLAALGADVIHLEAIQRPDGMRMAGGAFIGREAWWEYSALFCGTNANKRDLTLDLSTPEGRELLTRLLGRCDVFVENFSPRVVEGFGLAWDALHPVHPRLVMTRMPAFGLDGPWRDNVGFAQTMEQMTGLAWLTGHPDDQPRIQRGPCDPLAGMHAAFATLVALFERDASGTGHHLECTMVEGALNAAAEQVIEYTAYGHVMQREGNRAPHAAPQNLYACRGEEQWLALSVESDAQWRALVALLGSPDWATDPTLADHAGRRRHHDRLDEKLSQWAAARELAPTVEALLEAGIPAAALTDPRTSHTHPQMQARGFYETLEHPVVGTHPLCTVPFRYVSAGRWLRRATPTLGQHSREILRELLTLSDPELDALEERQIIGTHLAGLAS